MFDRADVIGDDDGMMTSNYIIVASVQRYAQSELQAAVYCLLTVTGARTWILLNVISLCKYIAEEPLTIWMTSAILYSQIFIDCAEFYGVFTRSSKRSANFQQMYLNTRANAGRLLDRVNTLLLAAFNGEALRYTTRSSPLKFFAVFSATAWDFNLKFHRYI